MIVFETTSRGPLRRLLPDFSAAPTSLVPGMGSSVIAMSLGGLLAASSFEPLGFRVAAPVAMALLWWGIQRESRSRAPVLGLCFGLAYMLPLLWWLDESIGTAAWLALGTAQALFLAIASLGIRVVRDVPAAPLWGGLIWVSAETIRSSWPLGGMPWGRLGVTALDSPWEPALAHLGIAGTSLLVATTGFGVAHLVLLPRRVMVLWLVIPMTIGLVAATLPFRVPSVGSARVAVVQGGVPGDGTDLVAHHRAVTRNHLAATQRLATSLTAQGRSVDLVVWPENATALDPAGDPALSEAIGDAAVAVDAPVLVGAIVDGPRPEQAFNRGVLWSSDGIPVDSYTKAHPVPFGEYIPWRPIIGDRFSRFEEIPRDMLPGSGQVPLQVNGVPVADAICFDVAYDDVLPAQVRRGARVAVVQTSNATFTGTAQPAQQFEITRARAVELGRDVVVASTNGVSGFISADGSVRARNQSRGTEVLIETVQLRAGLTPAVRFEQQRTLVIVGGAMVALLLAAWRYAASRRARRASDPA